MNYKTEQEQFWAGHFGDEYIRRERSSNIVTGNVVFFGNILKSAPGVSSALELGCNKGLNLEALEQINPDIDLCAYEINEAAVGIARTVSKAHVVHGTILDPIPTEKTYDLTFTKGVLIHIEPESLHRVYENLYNLSKRYILICEYYNPTPVMVNYRGNEDRLFKRDFAGEMMDKYKLRLVNYGFTYHRDSYFPQDDISWFLLEK